MGHPSFRYINSLSFRNLIKVTKIQACTNSLEYWSSVVKLKEKENGNKYPKKRCSFTTQREPDEVYWLALVRAHYFRSGQFFTIAAPWLGLAVRGQEEKKKIENGAFEARKISSCAARQRQPSCARFCEREKLPLVRFARKTLFNEQTNGLGDRLLITVEGSFFLPSHS